MKPTRCIFGVHDTELKEPIIEQKRVIFDFVCNDCDGLDRWHVPMWLVKFIAWLKK